MAKESKVLSGTERVIDGVKPFIPAPHLPSEIKETPPKKAAPKPATDRTAQHQLVPQVAINHEQNRMARLRSLGRTVREVAWLLAEYQKLKTPVPTQSTKK